MTNAEQRRLTNWRLKLLLAAGEAGNVARTCRHFAISRKTFYKYLRQHYHFGPGKIVDYLKRFHSLSIACATVHRILCRHRMNRRPANQNTGGTRIRMLKVYDACNQRTAIEFIGSSIATALRTTFTSSTQS